MSAMPAHFQEAVLPADPGTPEAPERVTLAAILARPDVWRGDALAGSERPGLPTGHPALDAALPGGGWPRGALSECLAAPDTGLAGLLVPALAGAFSTASATAFTNTPGPLLLVNPPHPLHAPGWAAAGLAPARLVIVDAGGQEAAWACETALEEGGFAALLAWLPEIGTKALRRLQVAAESHPGPAWIVRPPARATEASPAPLRLAVADTPGGLEIRILKRRGSGLPRPLLLTPALAVTALQERHRALARPALPLPAPGRPGPAPRHPVHA